VSGGDSETYREVERKLRVHGLYRLPDLVAATPDVVGAVQTEPLIDHTAIYYDTGDLRLARSRVTLRRREGGTDDGWHLKLPVEDVKDAQADAAVRDEVRAPLTDGGVPPAELTTLVLAVTRGAPVEPVATLRTERRPYLVLAADGHVIAEVTDDTVSVLDGPHVAARFRELEVESREGTDEEIAVIVAALVESGAIEGGLPSKAVRALGPAATAPPDVPTPGSVGAVGPKEPAGTAVRAHLARHTTAFLDQDLRVRRGLPDSVHQMRVAARRLRSGLKVFTPLVDQDWATHVRDELSWIAGELGQVRDLEVLEERLLRDLAALPSATPQSVDPSGADPAAHDAHAAADTTDRRDVAAAQAVVRKEFDTRLPAVRAELTEAMTSRRYLALLDLLVDAVRHPQLTEEAQRPAAEVLPPLMTKAWHRLAKDAAELRQDGTDDSWHETRIAAKKARYAAEALTPVFGGPAKSLAKDLERVTELLGEHQDAVIAARTARELAVGRRVTGTTGFVLGLLHAAERDAVRAVRHTFAHVWPDIAHAKGAKKLAATARGVARDRA
jgi:inorganic triphosphatase YgiF